MNRTFMVFASLLLVLGGIADPVTKTQLGSLHPRTGLVVTDVDLSGIGGGSGDGIPWSWATDVNVVLGAGNFIESNDVTVVGHANIVEGTNAVSLGFSNTSKGESSMTVGLYNDSDARGSLAIGIENAATGKESLALGHFAKAFGDFSYAVGYGSSASNSYSSAFGPFAEALGQQTASVGPGASSKGLNTVAIGTFAASAQTNSVAIGTQAVATNGLGVAIGPFANAGDTSLAIGYAARADKGSVSVGLGLRPPAPNNFFYYMSGASAMGMRSIAIGGYVDTNANESVSIGPYAFVTNKNAVVISASNGTRAPENRSHGDGTITLGVSKGLSQVYVGTNRMDVVIIHEVRTAASAVCDYIFDTETSVCYRRQMRGGYLDYVAVTNIDVRLPENYAALAALEESR